MTSHDATEDNVAEVSTTDFDTAVLNSVSKVLHEDHPDPLLKGTIDKIRAKFQRRSRSRSPDRQRSRSRSPRASQSVSPDRGSRPRKTKRDSSKIQILQNGYKKYTYESVKIRYDVNKTQLTFNEHMISTIHDAAAKIPSHCTERLLSLFDLKKSIMERQENILVADKYGLQVASMVDESKSLPISKKKQKQAEEASKFLGNRSGTSQQPFLGPRGGQPRETSTSYDTYSGPFAGKHQFSTCYKCGQNGHWANQCFGRYGQTAFRRSNPGTSGVPKPLFNSKSG